MSDRMSRLAEIRRLRDQNRKENSGADNNEQLSRAEEIQLPKKPESPISTSSKIHSSINADGSNSQELPILAESLLQEKPSLNSKNYQSKMSETGDKAESEQEPLVSTYNSDLKNDLSSLLKKAKNGTDRAFNEVIWRTYLDNQPEQSSNPS